MVMVWLEMALLVLVLVLVPALALVLEVVGDTITSTPQAGVSAATAASAVRVPPTQLRRRRRVGGCWLGFGVSSVSGQATEDTGEQRTRFLCVAHTLFTSSPPPPPPSYVCSEHIVPRLTRLHSTVVGLHCAVLFCVAPVLLLFQQCFLPSFLECCVCVGCCRGWRLCHASKCPACTEHLLRALCNTMFSLVFKACRNNVCQDSCH